MSLKTIKRLGALLVTAAAMAVRGGEAADYTGGNIGVKGWKLPVTDGQIAQPFRVTFKFRATGTNPASKGHHWGLDFTDRDGNAGKLYTGGTGVCFDLKSPGGNWLTKGQVTAKNTSVPVGVDAPWATFELKATDVGFSVRYNGEYATMETRQVLPLKKLSLYHYNTALEVKDFMIEPVGVQADEPIANPTFRASFDGTLDAYGADGQKIAPSADRASAFSDEGVTGRSLVFSDRGFGGNHPHLVYPISNAVSSAQGGVMAWVRHPSRGGAPIRFLNAEGQQMLSLSTSANDDWALVHVAMEGGKTLAFQRRVGMGAKRDGDWFHLAFTWRPDGVALLFIDGIPFATASSPGERYQWPVIGNRLGEIAQVRFEKFARGDDRQNWVSDVRVYRRTIGHREIDDVYRRGMPVDLVFNEAAYPADVPMQVTPTIAPGGWFRRPAPYEGMGLTKALVDLKMTIARYEPVFGDKKDATRRTGWKKIPVAGGETVYRNLRVHEVQDVPCDPIALPEGEYALTCEVSHRRPDDGGTSRFVRTLCFDVTKNVDLTTLPATKEPWKLGELVVDRVFDRADDMELKNGAVAMRETGAGRYLEVGAAGGERVSTVVDFPESALGQPCVLEVEWPDDKTRLMGLYMHRDTGPKGMENRDRLQCGIQAGDSYPNTGRMQKSRFYFYPSTAKMLFEVRTLAGGRPAAVRALRVWRIAELPRLAVRKPKGFKARSFGHMDEDQTVDNNFNPEHTKRNSAKTTDEIVKYCAYTGQNAFHYALVRYWFTLGPVEGARWTGLYPKNQGDLGSTIAALGRNGIDYYGRIYLRNAPQGMRFRETDCKYFERGWLQVDREGNVNRGYDRNVQCNIGNPDLQDALVGYFADFVQRYSTRGMAGVDYDLVGGWFGAFAGLQYGYDDYNVAAFQRDSGVTLPEDCAVPALVADRLDVTRAPTPKAAYPKRHDFLTDTNSTVRAKWLAWRAGRVTDYMKKLLRRLREANPDFTIYVKVGSSLMGMGGNNMGKEYAERGVDVPALMKIPGLKIGVSRGYTSHAWNLFRGLDEGDSLDGLYDANLPLYRIVKEKYGAWPMAASSGAYFETFVKTLDDVNFRSYFQDQDVKPWGRYFLKEPAFCVGVGDALNYQIGDQPPGMLGAEDETREFCQAYCALPAVPFTDMGGVTDPIVGRYLVTKEGTYFYVVNMHHTPQTAVLSDKAKAVDLSTDETDTWKKIELKPFQLRSFFMPGAAQAFGPLAVKFSREAKTCHDGRLAEIDRVLDALEKAGDDVTEARAARAAGEAAFARGALCEAHRQFYLQPIEKAFIAFGDIANRTEQRTDRAKGVVRVDCGSKTFTRTGGRLFSPDQAWDGKTYGYLGKAMRSFRETRHMEATTDCLEVYNTESYDVDGYRFKLEPGTYRLRMLFHCGWEPDWRADWWLFDVTANGQALAKPFDLYKEVGGDINKAAALEKDVTVGADGLLTVRFVHVPGKGRDPRGQSAYPCVRFVNAIEVQKK